MLASTPRPAELFPSPAMQSDHSAQILDSRKFTGQRTLFHASSRPVTTLSTFSGAHCHRSTTDAIRRTLAQRKANRAGRVVTPLIRGDMGPGFAYLRRLRRVFRYTKIRYAQSGR